MFRIRLNLTRAVVASIAGLVHAVTLHAQEPRNDLSFGLAVSTQYPDRFQVGCGNPLAAAPTLRAGRRISGVLSAELGVSGMFQLPPGPYCSDDAVPLADGDVVRDFAPSRGNLSLAGEARVVITPIGSADGDLRLIGGGAWYPARSSPAWIVGAGYRPPASWGALVFDVEYWTVGAAYDLERFRVGAPRERLGDGREWQGFLQFRVGITVWSS